jgi:hypothetical protein
VRPGSHAAGDGSFGRSAGINVGKALALVAIAVVIGAVLLHRNPGSVNVSAAGETSTTAKKSKAAATTTTTAPVEVTTTTQAVRAPSAVKVLVANGTSTSGLAGFYSNKLHGLGYDTLASTNTTVKVAASIVYYAPSFQPEALAIAKAIGAQASALKPMPVPSQVPVANINGANIVVILGPDLARVGGTTATTRHVTTSST